MTAKRESYKRKFGENKSVHKTVGHNLSDWRVSEVDTQEYREGKERHF